MLAEGIWDWTLPSTWLTGVKDLGIANMLLVFFALAASVILWRLWPVASRRISRTWDSHDKFMDTATATLDMHARANITNANSNAANAQTLKALESVVEESVAMSAGKISDLVDKMNITLTAGLQMLDELEERHKGDVEIVRSISRVRVRLIEAKDH